MNGRFLLDTNIIISIFAKDITVMERLDSTERVCIPVIALGEMYYGAQKSMRSEANIARITEFAARVSILICDEETSLKYGQIKNALRAKGRPIPDNDIWIAAIALQHHLTLVSRDEHFNQVERLSVVAW